MLKVKNMTKNIDVLVPARCVRVRIKLRARPMHHMLEDGSTRVDAKILQPITIDMELIAPNADTLGQMDNVFMDRSSIYSVASRGILFRNMRMNFEGIEQSAEMLNAVPARIQFMQLMYQGSGAVVYKAPADSSVIDKGMSMLKSATGTVTGLVDKAKTVMSLF